MPRKAKQGSTGACRKRWLAIAILAIPLLLLRPASSGSVPSDSTPKAEPVSVFNSAYPDPILKPSQDDLEKPWFEAPVTAKAGQFNPVFLPFAYEDSVGELDAMEPLTFPSLLSFKFDFVPDNYSARHPAFIYRKLRVWDVKPGENEKIANYINYWEATHAFGGTVLRTKQGYTGTLLVFDRTGSQILRKTYDTPVPYFTLMGQMVQTWMAYRNQPVSEGLAAELTRPMTTDMECVRLYGTSFYKPWRSDAEWAVYDEILRRDPHFAEVRFWYANQKAWTTEDFAGAQVEKGRALQSHLVMSALNEFNASQCRDRRIVADYHKALAHAKQICPQHSTVLATVLDVEGHRLSVAQLDAYLEVVTQYPCSCNLIDNLAWEYRQRGCYEKSIPLLLSAVHSGYMKGVGNFTWEWYLLTQDFYKLGYLNEAIFCGYKTLEDCDEDRLPRTLWYLGKAFQDRFYFVPACKIFIQRQACRSDSRGALMASLCAEQSSEAEWREKADKLKVEDSGLNCLKTARRFLAVGLPDEALAQIKSAVQGSSNAETRFQGAILQSDLCALSGRRTEALEHAKEAWLISPRNRQVAFLLKQTAGEESLALARYAKAGIFICPGDPRWQSLLNEFESSLEADTYEAVLRRFRAIQREHKSTDPKREFEFWTQFFPFEVEYIAMVLLSEPDASIHNEVLGWYLRYGQIVKRISEEQKIHTRMFFLQLLGQMSESQRKPWINKLNRGW